MGHNEITMNMDVKMDLKEKKLEYFRLRTWTRCTVKIEAIKYIPCFVKITLIQCSNDENSDVVIKINVPGLAVHLASSRSKDHSYGLFWTQHRKNCCIFFALDSKDSMDRHIDWVQNSIINLETFRREMLESRRASRISRMDDSVVRSSNSSIDRELENCNETQNIKDINDILGPLPKLPDSNVNWSRRISSTSDIYEEIGDARNFNRKMSRTSIASGIYEVMTSPVIPPDEIARMLEEMPPPLPPPRPRVNTQTELNRAYTNPESISSKKRKRNIFETVFSRHKSLRKRKNSKSKDHTASAESPTIELIRSHRMSYSSPDLRKTDVEVDINQCVKEFENELMARSSATEFSIRNENSILDSTISDKDVFDGQRNVSENILSSFNISCNDSNVNLVGSNFNAQIENKPAVTIIDCPSGYCQMAPIIRSNSASSYVSAPEPAAKSPVITVNTSQQQTPLDVTKAITFCRDYGMEASLQNFENLTISKGSSKKSSKDKKTISSHNSSDQTKSKKCTGSPKPNNSFDEKYPSYYPNDVQKTPPKIHRKNDEIDYLAKPSTPERKTQNLYIASPRHGTNRSTKIPKDSSNLVIPTPTKPLVLSNATELLTPSMKPSIPETVSDVSPHFYHKYATVTPLKEAASCKKSNDITSSMKRFSSLPRFKKIDFSPLRFKINSVLQRHNPDQM